MLIKRFNFDENYHWYIVICNNRLIKSVIRTVVFLLFCCCFFFRGDRYLSQTQYFGAWGGGGRVPQGILAGE